MKNKLLILGCGGHGSVVADAVEQSDEFTEIYFLDDKFGEEDKDENPFSNLIIGKISKKILKSFRKKILTYFVAIGNNNLRIKLLKEIKNTPVKIPKIIHPTAEISKYSFIDTGVFIGSKVVVNCSSKIYFGSILNTSCIIDHDTKIGFGSHISPGVNIAGNVSIGNQTWIGIGSQIINNITIGDNVIVGGGSLVLENIPNDVKAYGSPAKIFKDNKK